MEQFGTSDRLDSVYPPVPDMTGPQMPYPLFPDAIIAAPEYGEVAPPAASPIARRRRRRSAARKASPARKGNSVGNASAAGNGNHVPIYGLALFLPNGQRASNDTHRVMSFNNDIVGKSARAKEYLEMPVLRDIAFREGRSMYSVKESRKSYLEGCMAFCVGQPAGNLVCSKRGKEKNGAFPVCILTPDGVGCASCHYDAQGKRCDLYG